MAPAFGRNPFLMADLYLTCTIGCACANTSKPMQEVQSALRLSQIPGATPDGTHHPATTPDHRRELDQGSQYTLGSLPL